MQYFFSALSKFQDCFGTDCQFYLPSFIASRLRLQGAVQRSDTAGNRESTSIKPLILFILAPLLVVCCPVVSCLCFLCFLFLSCYVICAILFKISNRIDNKITVFSTQLRSSLQRFRESRSTQIQSVKHWIFCIAYVSVVVILIVGALFGRLELIFIYFTIRAASGVKWLLRIRRILRFILKNPNMMVFASLLLCVKFVFDMCCVFQTQFSNSILAITFAPINILLCLMPFMLFYTTCIRHFFVLSIGGASEESQRANNLQSLRTKLMGIWTSIKNFFCGDILDSVGLYLSANFSRVRELITSKNKVDWGRFLRGFLYVFIPKIPLIMTALCSNPLPVVVASLLLTIIVVGFCAAAEALYQELCFRYIFTQLKERGIAPRIAFFLILLSGFIVTCVFSVVDIVTIPVIEYYMNCLQYAVVAYATQGLELSWGMHFANIFLGYLPSLGYSIPVTCSAPTYFVDRVSGLALILQLLSYMKQSLYMMLPIYVVETYFRENKDTQSSSYVPLPESSRLTSSSVRPQTVPSCFRASSCVDGELCRKSSPNG